MKEYLQERTKVYQEALTRIIELEDKNAELLEALEECLVIHGHGNEQVWREGEWKDASLLEPWEFKATEAIRKAKGD